MCDVTCTTAGGNTQPRWQPTTTGDAVVRATVTALAGNKEGKKNALPQPQSRNFFIDLIAVYCAICADRVQSGLCLPSRVRVRVVYLRHFSGLHRLGSHFQIKYGSGSVPCSTFTGLYGFGYEFLNPWRPLLHSTIKLMQKIKETTISQHSEKQLLNVNNNDTVRMKTHKSNKHQSWRKQLLQQAVTHSHGEKTN